MKGATRDDTGKQIMRLRAAALGRGGPIVSRFGLGTMTFGAKPTRRGARRIGPDRKPGPGAVGHENLWVGPVRRRNRRVGASGDLHVRLSRHATEAARHQSTDRVIF